MAELPTVTADALKANSEIAARAEGGAGQFVTEWLENLITKENQPMLAAFIVEMCDSFFEESKDKIKAVAVLGIVLNSIKATTEAKELEELFTETA